MNVKEVHKTNGTETLTKREVEILKLWVKGYSYKTIAQQIYISPETVRKHLQNIYKKLRVNNKIEALNKLNKTKFL